jgi:CheY-like chemotaxis protein
MYRIAVVEDFVDARDILRVILEPEYDVRLFEDGTSFLKAFDTDGEFDLVLLDLRMPDMDGFLVLENVLKQKRKRRPPVVAVTANAMSGDREKALAAGFDDYITKPYDFLELLACVQRHVTR